MQIDFLHREKMGRDRDRVLGAVRAMDGEFSKHKGFCLLLACQK